jgi:hypothetical protein
MPEPRWHSVDLRLPLKLLTGAAGIAAACATLLAAPWPFFPCQLTFENITVYSDRTIPPTANVVLHEAANRIAGSPLASTTIHHRVFICNSTRLFTFFTTYQNHAGGVNYALLNRNIFMRPANFESNRLIAASGNPVPGDRPLSYFLAHEMTHSLEALYLGRLACARLPEWKREGYADLIGKGDTFSLPSTLLAFRNHEPTLDPKASGLYLRYQLLTEWAMRTRRLTAQQFLTTPLDPAELEKEMLQSTTPDL